MTCSFLIMLVLSGLVNQNRYLNYAQNNRMEWAAKGEEIVREMVEKYGGNSEEAAELQNIPEQDSITAEVDV